ncbi:MAG: hypothetical protein IKW97_00860 [Muribaculaceae bacterium]|nr:hypothetical protein [Muribaculaceae bacterium]
MEENNEQYLLELRQRINAKAEEMVKINYSGGTKPSKTVRRIAIAVLVALFVWIEVFLYNKNDFWETNALMGVFIIVSFIGHYLMTLIMRHFLTSMKNASTAPQHYRAVKRLILTHKLRYLISLALGWAAGGVVAYRLGSAYYWSSIPAATACFIGTIIGAAMRNWYLDEDFRYDVEELGDLIKQESAD